MCHVKCVEPLHPPVEGIPPGYSQRDRRDRTSTGTMIAEISPLKEGQIGARTRKLATIEKMIGRNIILIHRLLHQTHTKHLSIKRNVAKSISGYSGHMVDTT